MFVLYICIINDFLFISNYIYEMYLYKLCNNYFLKILSDFFNNGFKYDILVVKIYFLKLIFVFLYDIGN